jgi:hypothetical protein
LKTLVARLSLVPWFVILLDPVNLPFSIFLLLLVFRLFDLISSSQGLLEGAAFFPDRAMIFFVYNSVPFFLLSVGALDCDLALDYVPRGVCTI